MAGKTNSTRIEILESQANNATARLDVHDVGLTTEPIEAGWVLTCEPAIYLKKEGFGVRLENDILITENGYVDLMADIPIEAEEIEEIMNRGAAGKAFKA